MLTDDMTRLSEEIRTLRKMRNNLMTALSRDSRSRKLGIAEFCNRLESARTAMAKQTKNERVTFFNNLKHVVGAQRQALQADLAGARRAWAGKGA